MPAGLLRERGAFEQQLKDAPQFSDDSWDGRDRDWETRTHRHYGVNENYWELGPRGA